ncbi:TonB-dependent receptor domain-containing protein [Botryobacter ruber]|uniref:TonB-dependent receptor domain-containing protein n=1 Tax=Botryobacter ruber TaxID=2171629 RepID=UPI000E0AEDF9|nr:outer membrane beta-barrel family protein [Botryobacter ruber]
MKNALSFVLLWCFVGSLAVGQHVNPSLLLKGTVLDAASNQPMEFVTVVVKVAGNTQPLKSTLTDQDGRFRVEVVPAQQYEVVCSFVGYQVREMPVPAQASGIVDLGNILLLPDAKQLSEVQVVSERALVTYEIDKTVYHVAADPESKTSQAIDMLRKVPHLTVDADDNIKLKGNGNYVVLINGKPSTLFARNAKDAFRSMPANSIKSIEVMTTPPARYDAEGIGGVINIVTHRQQQGGYNGSVNLSASRPAGYYAGGYLTAIRKKVGFSAYFGYNKNASPDSRFSLTRKNHTQGNSRLEQQGEKDYRGNFQYLETELSYEPDSLNLLSASFSYNANRGSNFYTQHVQSFDPAGQLQQAYTQQYDVQNTWRGHDLGADYQRSFRKNKEQLFTLSYKLRATSDNATSDFNFFPVLHYNGSLNKTENSGSFREHTFQADYVHPIKEQQVELGVKSIFRANESNYYYKSLNANTDTYEVNKALSNLFNYTQDIHAAYASVTLHHAKWGLKAGGRLENTRVKADFRSSGTVARQEQLNFIPNIIVSRQLQPTSILKLAYLQRIERPSLYYLNPYQNSIDPKNISFGNPGLVPAVSNQLDLSYNAYFGGTSVSAGTYFNFTNNSIQRFTTTGTDGVARTTYGNIGSSSNVGISFSSNIDLLEKININLNSNGNYTWLSSIIDGNPQHNKGFTFDAFLYLSYKFLNTWRVSGNAGYHAPGILLQGKSGDYFYNSFALNKDILNEKGSLSFNVSNPFRKERRWFNQLETPAFYQFQESHFLQRWFSLTFNYRFGKLEEEMVRKKRGIENNDIKAAEKKVDGI